MTIPDVEDIPKPRDGEDLMDYMKRCRPEIRAWIIGTLILGVIFATAREKVAESR